MSHRPDHKAPPEREEIPFKTGFSPSTGLMPVITSALGIEAVVRDGVHCDFKSWMRRKRGKREGGGER